MITPTRVLFAVLVIIVITQYNANRQLHNDVVDVVTTISNAECAGGEPL